MQISCDRKSNFAFLGEKWAGTDRHLAQAPEAEGYRMAVALPFDALKRAVGQLVAILLRQGGNKGEPDQALVALACVESQTCEACGQVARGYAAPSTGGGSPRVAPGCGGDPSLQQVAPKEPREPLWKAEAVDEALAGLWEARRALLTASGERCALQFLALDQACGCSVHGAPESLL
jgi:hypothetical protein